MVAASAGNRGRVAWAAQPWASPPSSSSLSAARVKCARIRRYGAKIVRLGQILMRARSCPCAGALERWQLIHAFDAIDVIAEGSIASELSALRPDVVVLVGGVGLRRGWGLASHRQALAWWGFKSSAGYGA